ncbi:TnsA endonuclease N-terminal domain-containing protein [Herminiimonas sp. KBW02]|uniref:TnsA endonuclease N-terminal domain-containing protein n=1 Tax=Herminiimonas sp. KBW02 TaxID=2153363 RepID=UPI001315761C|nr:TnsA endonuclease N-terminal domain-containing protein [Herminiimonas sp. KBW02]
MPNDFVSRSESATPALGNQRIRAREPVGRSFGSVRGKFPSQKMGRMIHWESQLERDAVYLFEFSPGVLAYREQPFKTYYTLAGKTRRYTPDFELTLANEELLLIEVKPMEKLQDIEEQRRFECIFEHFSAHGKSFRVLTEIQIRQSDLLDNLRMMMRYRCKPLTKFQRLRFAEQFTGRDAISFDEVRILFGSCETVWMLINEGLLICDLKVEVGAGTIFSTSAKGDSYEDFLF